MKIDSSKIVGRKIAPEDVKHGDIIKFTSSKDGVKVEKTGTIQYIYWNDRLATQTFFTENFRPYDPVDSRIGDGRNDELHWMGHEDSSLDTAEVGDWFENKDLSREHKAGKVTKHTEGYWILESGEKGKDHDLMMITENVARMLFRNGNSTLFQTKADDQAVFMKDGKVNLVEGDKVRLTETALNHEAFLGWVSDGEYVVAGTSGESVLLRVHYPFRVYESNSAIVHYSHLVKVS